jgi:hypothetical protein
MTTTVSLKSVSSVVVCSSTSVVWIRTNYVAHTGYGGFFSSVRICSTAQCNTVRTAAARVRRTAINVVDVSDVTRCQNMVDVSDVVTCQNICKVSEHRYPDKNVMWQTFFSESSFEMQVLNIKVRWSIQCGKFAPYHIQRDKHNQMRTSTVFPYLYYIYMARDLRVNHAWSEFITLARESSVDVLNRDFSWQLGQCSNKSLRAIGIKFNLAIGNAHIYLPELQYHSIRSSLLL